MAEQATSYPNPYTWQVSDVGAIGCKANSEYYQQVLITATLAGETYGKWTMQGYGNGTLMADQTGATSILIAGRGNISVEAMFQYDIGEGWTNANIVSVQEVAGGFIQVGTKPLDQSEGATILECSGVYSESK